MNKWLARGILLFIIIYGLWVIFKCKNNLIDFKNPSSINSFKDKTNHFFQVFSDYAQKTQTNNHHTNTLDTKTSPKKPWKMEEKCRTILQNIYGVPFPSKRPSFLKSPKTNKNLELDCYNEQLGIALEYNGVQHYSYTPYFHKDKKNFYSQVHRDNWKRNKCWEHGITLIEIPYTVPENELEQYIFRKLKQYRKI